MIMWNMRALLFLGVTAVFAQDTCDQCIEAATEMQAIWSNATSVAEILESLETECADKFTLHPEKKKVCDAFVSVLVTVPPALLDGLVTLAWDIPEGICLTIGQCSAPCCEVGAGPEQIHLSLPGMGDGSKMGVSWVDLDGVSSVVQYKKADGSGDVLEATGTVTTYPDEQQLAHNKSVWPASQGSWVGAIHRAVMTNLEPQMAYLYRVGDGDDCDKSLAVCDSDEEFAVWSEWISFKTFPSADAFIHNTTTSGSSSAVSFAIVGDMGYGDKSDSTVANLVSLVESGAVDAVVHTGDVGYADGFMPHWDLFLNKVQPLASRVPYMVVAGNHEIWYNFSSFKHRFMMPGVGPLSAAGDTTGSGDGMFYEWGVPGLIHFTACDSETDADTASFKHPGGSDQVSWMGQVLAKANTPEARASEPWSVAHFHRPLYCSNDGECDHGNSAPDVGMATILRAQAEPLFTSNSVDLLVSGHIHSYERSLPMAHGNATSLGYEGPGLDPVYLVQGSSGNRETNHNFPADLPAWSAGHSSEIGFGVLKVTRDQMDFSFFKARAADEGGPQLLDHFTMTK